MGFERVRSRLAQPLLVFGRVPMFFYLVHVPVIGLTAVAWATWVYGQPVNFFAGPEGVPAAYAPSLPRAYLAWGLTIAALYPLCARFDRYKRAHPEKRWLRFL